MNRIANGGYIEVILTSDIGYTCDEIIDNLLIEGVNFAAVNFVNRIYRSVYSIVSENRRTRGMVLPTRRLVCHSLYPR